MALVEGWKLVESVGNDLKNKRVSCGEPWCPSTFLNRNHEKHKKIYNAGHTIFYWKSVLLINFLFEIVSQKEKGFNFFLISNFNKTKSFFLFCVLNEVIWYQ